MEARRTFGTYLPKVFHGTLERVSSIVHQDINLTAQALGLLEDCRACSRVRRILPPLASVMETCEAGFVRLRTVPLGPEE